MSEKSHWISFNTMEQFMVDVFMGVGVPEEDAKICADVLITSDKRGIDSHGIGRLKPIYVDRINEGIINPVTNLEVVKEGPTTAVIDGHNGMGQLAGGLWKWPSKRRKLTAWVWQPFVTPTITE